MLRLLVRRLSELRGGEAKAIPGEEVFALLADALRAKPGHR